MSAIDWPAREAPGARPFQLDAGFGPAGSDVAARIARLLAAPVAPDPAPSWLLSHQVEPFGRALAAVRAHGGALIALPVGSGKSYLALAVALALGIADPLDVVAPAILANQWRRLADQLGIPIRFSSHESLSRGRPLSGSGPVIVDESHRFRNPSTRRYRALAPALIGRPTILVSATPIVNQLRDLTAQLALAARDDALAFDGVASIRATIETGRVSEPLGRLVIAGVVAGRQPTARSERIADWGDDRHLDLVVRAIDRLRLARERSVAALIRISLYRAAGSSPAALIGSLRRYRRLLDHAASARRAGHSVNRSIIQATIAADPDQLLFWDLLPHDGADPNLALDDGPRLDRLERLARRWTEDDRKLERLRTILENQVPTVAFATAVETIDYLRQRLPGPGIAWITGAGAGVGHLRASRAAVLGWFDPDHNATFGSPPRVLLASDVAAEGLNLQRAGRVIHYDLPWTAVRLEQRDGRAIRQGSRHREVEVVRFEVPAGIEARLSLASAVARKAALPAKIGLGAEATLRVTRDQRLAATFGGGAASGGWWATERPGRCLAGLRLMDGSVERASLVLARVDGRPWSDDRNAIEAALTAARLGGTRLVHESELAAALDSLIEPVTRRLATINGGALFGGAAKARLMGSFSNRLEDQRRRRDVIELEQLAAIGRFLGRGHTAGEATVAERIVRGEADAHELGAALGRATQDAGPVEAVLVALVI